MRKNKSRGSLEFEDGDSGETLKPLTLLADRGPEMDDETTYGDGENMTTFTEEDDVVSINLSAAPGGIEIEISAMEFRQHAEEARQRLLKALKVSDQPFDVDGGPGVVCELIIVKFVCRYPSGVSTSKEF